MFVANNAQISKYLTVGDVTKSNTAIKLGINNQLPIELLENAKSFGKLYDIIYDHFKGNIYFNSIYRGPALNDALGGATNSRHMKCLAGDLEGKNGVKNSDIFKFVKENLQFSQLIWEFGTSTEPAWVHVLS